MDGQDFNMPTNYDAAIQYFAWRSLSVHLISTFLCQKKKTKQNKTTIKKKKNKIYVKRYIENSKGQSKQKESQKKESVRKYKR